MLEPPQIPGRFKDTQDAKLESFLTDIVVELIVAGEARYRHAVIGHHQHLVELKARLEEEERQRKLEAERRAKELREQKERERIEHLLEQATALEKAATIRKFVENIRAIQDEIDAPSATIEKWADWALSQADRIDPVRNPSFLQLVDDDNLHVG